MAENLTAATRGGRPLTAEDLAAVKRRGDALLAGFADLGGLTNKTADAIGWDDLAEWLRVTQVEEPGSAMLGSAVNPASIAGPIWDAASGLFDAGKNALYGEPDVPPKIMSREEFFADKRPRRKTLEEAMSEAEAAVRSSKAYEDAVASGKSKVPNRLAEAARKSAGETWRAGQQTIASEDDRLQSQYDDYKADVNKQLESFYGRDFADRNPGLSKALPVIGTLAAAIATRGAFKFANKRTDDLAKELQAAFAESDPTKYAGKLKQAENWAGREKYVKYGTAGLASTFPLDTRVAATVQDSKQSREYQDADGNWQRSRAQEAAENDLSSLGWWGKELGTGLISGGIGALAGAKFAGHSAHAAADNGSMPGYSDIEDAVKLMIASKNAKARVDAYQPPQGPGPGPGPGPLSHGVQIPTAGTQAPVGPQPLLGGSTQTPNPQQLPLHPAMTGGGPGGVQSRSSGPLDWPEENNAVARQYLDELLTSGKEMPDRKSIVSELMKRFPTKFRQDVVGRKFDKTKTSLDERMALEPDLADPRIREILLSQVAPGKNGHLAVPFGIGAAVSSQYPWDDTDAGIDSGHADLLKYLIQQGAL